MTTYLKASLLVLLLVLALAAAQPAGQAGVIVGQVFDADLNVPIEYANVVLQRESDSVLVTGTVTRADGRFTLADVPAGRYRVEVSFIGYRSVRKDGVEVAAGARVELGRTALRQTAVAMPGVEATAERPALTYKIDKKVVEVSGQLSATAGTAVDVLENLPSVKVDAAGDVALRGSKNFSVLIDGRPTLLEPSDALRQMPSGSLDRIEIITNPSAKYDAEGVSGIVNLVTKRRRGSGLSGVANGNSGIWGSYGGDFTLNWASGIVSAFAGADYTGRPTPGALAAQQWSAVGNDTLRVSTTGSSTRNRRLAGAHAGVDLNWAKTDRSSFTIFYGSTRMGFDQNGTTLQSRNSSSDTVHYQSINDVAQGGEYVSAAIEQHHGFGAASDTGHSLNVRAELQRRGHSGSATAELFQGGQVATGWRSTQSGPAFRWLLNADYALPVRKTGRFEAGYQSSFGRPTFDNGVYQYDTIADSFVRVSEYSSTTSLAYDVHALYSTWTGSWQRFEYMAGVRGEYSSQRIKDSSMDSTLLVTTEGLFPSARISYRPASDLVLQTSYARRTSRPVGRDFIPALTWQDAYNVVLGNPELRPEYIDSWEAEANSPLGGGQVAATAYCRRTQDKVDEVRSTFTEGVLLHESWNVGNDRALGGEFSFDFAPVRWWTLSPSADLYDYRIAGTVADMEFDRSSLNWTARLGNEFRLPTSTKLQLNVSYESPSVSAQGRKEGALTADLGVRQLLFKHLAIVLQARDLFGTSRENLTSEGAGFYTQSTYRPRAPVIGLSLNWNFNNFRPTSRMRDTGREES